MFSILRSYIGEHGVEFWFAREPAVVLMYAKWENFSKVIKRDVPACKNSGYEIEDHFPEVRKMVVIGSGTKRGLIDYQLTRYACYLIVQNGDPHTVPLQADTQEYRPAGS